MRPLLIALALGIAASGAWSDPAVAAGEVEALIAAYCRRMEAKQGSGLSRKLAGDGVDRGERQPTVGRPGVSWFDMLRDVHGTPEDERPTLCLLDHATTRAKPLQPNPPVNPAISA